MRKLLLTLVCFFTINSAFSRAAISRENLTNPVTTNSITKVMVSWIADGLAIIDYQLNGAINAKYKMAAKDATFKAKASNGFSKTSSGASKVALKKTAMFFADVTGDYRSKGTGPAAWNSASSWEVFDGVSWVNATSYPGQNAGTYSVTIQGPIGLQPAHTITLINPGITNQIGNLNINGTLSLLGTAAGGSSERKIDINTSLITIGGSPANLYFNYNGKMGLYLPSNSAIIILPGGQMNTLGSCDANYKIYIGNNLYSSCNGGGGSGTIAFGEVVTGGGSINAEILDPSTNPVKLCGVSTINLSGKFIGFETGVSYIWKVNGVQIGTGTLANNSSTTTPLTYTPPSAGQYLIEFFVTKGSFTNIETRTINVISPIDYANLQWPPNSTICEGENTTAYGQIYEGGLTDVTSGQAPNIVAEFGYNASNTNPATWTTWTPTLFNGESGNNDEYMATFGATLAPGTYYYTFRYSLSGCDWVYGGYDTLNQPFEEDFWDGTIDISGVLTVNANHAISLSSGSNTQTVCNNSAIEDIAYALSGGATNANVSGLPSGVNGSLSGSTFTISGTPDVAGTFNYTVTTSGNNCPTQQLGGTITVKSLDYVNLQSPSSGAICPGGSHTIYGQVYEPGITEAAGQGVGIEVEFGYNNANNNPSTWSNWTAASFNVQVGDNDEYQGTFGNSLVIGTYYYAFRYRLTGCEWQYGGLGGTWNNNSGVLTVQSLDYVNLQSPDSGTICEGGTFDAYGQVYEPGLTESAGAGNGIVAELGYGNNTNPASWTNWIAAAYNGQGGTNNNNDEYKATFGNSLTQGTYYYTFRYSLNNCEWQYGYFVNTTNYGVLTVNSAPEITNQTNVSVNNDAGQCGAIVNYSAATVTGVPTPTITYSQASGTFFPVGTTTVTVEATNSCGTDTMTFDVIVTDSEAPQAICKNITVELDANGQATIAPQDINNGSNDNCGNVTLGIDNSTFDCNNLNQPGYAASFTAGPDYILMGDSSTLKVSSQLSLEAWIYPTGPGSEPNGGGGIIINKEGEYEIARYSDGSIRFAIANTNPGWNWVFSGGYAPLNQWTHVAFTYNGSVAKTFINGSPVSSIGANGTITDSYPPDNNFRIGGRNSANNQYFNGNIDEVRVWNVALSDAQVGQQYNQQLIGNETGLIGYWGLDEGTGNTTDDKTSNGNNGTFVNQTGWVTPGAIGGNTNTVTLTVTDSNGNQSTCTATVTVEDNINPEITCPSNINVFATSAAGAVVNYTAPVGTDNCSATTALTAGPASDSTFPIGTTTVTYTATDTSGNVASCSFDVTVTGIAPDIDCPANITVNNDAGNCGAIVSFAATETAAIPASTITYDIQPGTFFNVGTTTVTATATNAVGSDSCTFTVTVNDNEDPVLAGVPVDANASCDNVPSAATPTASDICDPSPSIALNEVSTQDANTANVGHYNYTITRTWTATDVAGNDSSVVQVITVTDTEDPVLAGVPVDANASCDNVPSAATPTASDNCDPSPSIALNEVSTQDANAANVGHYNYTITRTWTATDVAGNDSSGTQVITVTDTEDPVLAGVPVDANASCDNVPSAATPTASDNCDPSPSIALNEVSTQDANAANVGHYNYTITRTWTATDVAGNDSSGTQVITVTDTEDPVLAGVPVDANASCDNVPSAATPTASDNCDPSPSIALNEVSTQDANTANVGHYNYTITRTWTATDVAGNDSSGTQVITVTDTEAPSITCPVDVTINCEDDTSTTANGSATGDDNCSAVAITYSDVSTQVGAGPSNQVWINEFHYDNTGTDAGEFVEVVSNFDANGYSIVLYNGSAPYDTDVLSSVSPSSGYYIYVLNYPSNGIQNGTADGLALVNTSGAVVQFLSYEGTITATSGPAAGMTSTDIGVSESGSGAIGNSLQLNGTGNKYSDFTWSAEAPATAGTANTSQTLVSGGALPAGYYNYTITRTWTATDVTGNATSCDQVITVQDVTPPTISDVADVTVNCQDDTSSASTGVATGSDICSAVTITESDSSTQDPDDSLAGHYNYTITRTWRATDVSGNYTESVQVITVKDDTAPEITCPVDVTINCEDDTSTTANGSATGDDNCSAVAITYSDVSTQVGAGPSNQVWINEFHYDNTGTDAGEFVEVVSNFDVSAYTIVFYNGNGGAPYSTRPLSLLGSSGDYNFYTATGISGGFQNGSPDGLALVDASNGVVQFLSYEGSFTAVGGPANGMSSTDIGVSESGTGAIGNSLQLNGTGNKYADFTWSAEAPATAGTANTTQTLVSGGTLTAGYYNYTITRTWTATDASGNSTSCDQVITVQDITPPTISDVADVTVNCQDDTSNASTGVATGSDICSAVTITESEVSTQDPDDSVAGHYNYTITRTWRATDVSGNYTESVQVITVEDVTNPTITDVPDVTVNCQDDNTSVATGVATGNDNCSPVAITQSDVSTQNNDSNTAGYYNYTITRTWRATDVTGLYTESNQIITVQDVTAPTVTDVADAVVNCEDDSTSAATGVATGNDNCSPVAITQSDVSTQNNDPNTAGYYNYTITRTWRATDVTGLFTESVQVITVQDVTAPVVNCDEITIVLDDVTGEVSIIGKDLDNEDDPSFDNCDSPLTYTLSQYDFSCNDIGGDLDYLIISEYVDGTVDNKAIEIFNGTGLQVNLYAEGYTLEIYPNGGGTIQIPLNGLLNDRNVFVVGNTYATATGITSERDYTPSNLDFDGNDAIALLKNGAVVDYIPAELWIDDVTLLRKKSISAGNLVGDEDEWIALGQDTFDNLGEQEINIVNQANNVELTVTDVSGNSASCEANVFVTDVTPPVANCTSIVVQLDVNGIYNLTQANINTIGGNSTDNCFIASIIVTPNSFDCSNVGSNPVTLTVIDKSGNVSTCSTTVTVQDLVNPIAKANDITVQLDANGQYILSSNDIHNNVGGNTDIDNGSTDACGIANYSVSPNIFDCDDVDPINGVAVTLTVTDNNGNSSSASATVFVVDNELPEAKCENITIQLDENGNANIVVADIDNGSDDNCEFTLALSKSSFTCEDAGENEVTLTITDASGNQDTCTAIVTVEGLFPVIESILPSELPPFCQDAAIQLTVNTNLNDNEIRSYQWVAVSGTIGTVTNEKVVRVYGNGTYGVTVTSETNCSVYQEYTVSGFDATELISSYTILAKDEIYLHGSNLVQSGGIGVTAANGLIKLHQATTVVGFGKAANFDLNQGSVINGGTYTSPAAPQTIPTFVANTYSNATSPDVIANSNTTLNGSVYDVVQIGQGVTLTFTEPNIYINQLVTQQNATIKFDGCANMFINQKFTLAQFGTINPDDNNIVIYVNADIQIEKGSYVRARMHSNGNEFLVKGENANKNQAPEPTLMKGLFIGRRVHGSINVKWEQDELCDTGCPIEAPGAGNSAKPDTGIDGIDDFEVSSWPNPSKTTFNLKVRTLDRTNTIQISVYDMSNKLIHTKSIKPDQEYNFGKELEGGVYIVKIEQAGKLKSVRVVKY